MVMSVPPSVPPKAAPVPPRAAAPGTAAPASAPGASARRHHVAELAPLLGRQYLGGVGYGLDEPLARRIVKRDLVCAEFFDCAAIYCLLRQKIPRGGTRSQQFFPHRQQIMHGAADDRTELVLLLGGRIDLDRQMPDHAVGVGLDDRLNRAVEEAASPVSYKTRWEPTLEWRGGGSHARHARQHAMAQSGASRRKDECPDQGDARDGRHHIGLFFPGAYALGR